MDCYVRAARTGVAFCTLALASVDCADCYPEPWQKEAAADTAPRHPPWTASVCPHRPQRVDTRAVVVEVFLLLELSEICCLKKSIIFSKSKSCRIKCSKIENGFYYLDQASLLARPGRSPVYPCYGSSVFRRPFR